MKRVVLTLLTLIIVLCSCSAEQAPTEGAPVTEATELTESTEPTVPTEPKPIEPINGSVGGVAPEAIFSEEKEQTRVTMSFVGDCQPGSDFGTHAEDSYNWYADNNPPEYFLGQVQWVFAKDDITVVDCESVLTDNTRLAPIHKDENPGYWHYGPTSNAQAFAKGSVEIAGVANNHTRDYGAQGYADTVKALTDAGIVVGEDLKPVYYEVKGVTVGVLVCNCWTPVFASRILQIIPEMNEKSDVQVIFPHGGTMNTYIPDEWRMEYFRKFIDAGAEVVAAGHPHALQPLESYNGGVIAYSLGNFSYGGSTLPENAGVILSVTLVFEEGQYKGLEYQVYPCYLYTTERNNYCPELIKLNDPSHNRILEFMYGLREAPVEDPRYLPEE